MRHPSRPFGEGRNLLFDTDFAESIPGASPKSAVAVGSLNETLKQLVEGGLGPLWVKGDVSDFKRHRNGHWYFTLRDASAQIRCVVWARDQKGIPAAPDDGMEICAYGRPCVYTARGDLHLAITKMEAVGDGLWQKALEITRRNLERDGLLALERKRQLPYSPSCIAVVTSPDGAAFRDVMAVVQRRAPHVQLVISSTKVQGEGAPEEICAAIDRVVRWGQAEVMIVGRGGGAREDLWAFNDERVARAIAASPIPVISAVGHEIDTTIADLVADFRAPTPSAAGEAVVPVSAELRETIKSYQAELVAALTRRIEGARYDLATHAKSIRNSTKSVIESRSASFKVITGRLQTLSPLATLSRGYAVARDPETGRTLSSTADFSDDRPFVLTVRDGAIAAKPIRLKD